VNLAFTTGGRSHRAEVATIQVAIGDDYTAEIQYTARFSNVDAGECTLDWTGVRLTNVRAEFASGEKLMTIVTSTRAATLVASTDGAKSQVVKISYHVQLAELDDLVGGFVLDSGNLPSAAHQRLHGSHERSPLIWEPDTIVRVQSERPTLLLGPRYYRQPPPRTATEDVFGFFENVTPFSIFVLSTRPQSTRFHNVLLYPHQSKPPVDSTVDEAHSMARSVENYFRRMFGDPSVRPGVVLLVSTPGMTSTCLGSDIVISANDSFSAEPSVHRRLLTQRLAHEYCHMWWSYSMFWADSETHDLVTEVLALLFEQDCVETLDVPSVAEERKEFWGYVTYASNHRNRFPRNGVSLSSVVSSGGLLTDLVKVDRNGVVTMLQDLWKQGRTSHLSLDHVIASAQTHVSEAFAVALRDALDHPGPIEAAARVERSSTGGWQISLRSSGPTHHRLRRRLIGAGLLAARTATVGPLRVLVPTRSELIQYLNALEPKHVLFRRSARRLAIERHPWLSRMWQWSTRISEASSFRARLGSLAKSILAIALNAEDPAGWSGLAMLLRALPRLEQKFMVRAARRATHAGEEYLHDCLQ